MQDLDTERLPLVRPPAPAPATSWLWLHILIGIVGATFVLFCIAMCSGIVLIKAATQALDEQSKHRTRSIQPNIERAAAATQVAIIRETEPQIQAIFANMQKENLAAAERARHANDPLPLPPRNRCLDKELFRKIANGIDQVTDGSARLYCR